MMVDTMHVKNGMTNFIHEIVIPMLPVKQQFLAGVGAGIIQAKSDDIIKNLSNNSVVKMLGIMDGEHVDVETLYSAAKEQMRRSGNFELDVPMIGTLRFSEVDIDALYQCIQRG